MESFLPVNQSTALYFTIWQMRMLKFRDIIDYIYLKIWSVYFFICLKYEVFIIERKK